MAWSLEEFESESQDGSRRSPVEKADSSKHKKLENVPLTNPLNRIAICMSGGGFRAAAFALGTLSYLNRVKFGNKSLLDQVCYISSASGGTITASMYALSKSRNDHSFVKFYGGIIAALKGETLLIEALTILNNDKEWKGQKNRNLINAFSIAYGKLFQNDVFGALNSKELRVCFNSTEFYRGQCFRFQNHGYIGNQFINLDKNLKEITGKIKLADILASSSCFPVGFEPIEFPNDFTHSSLSEGELQSTIIAIDYQGNKIKNAVIPLMDGGITDNQGTNSAMIADLNARSNGQEPIDLFIVTDVTSYFMDPYAIPKPGLFGFWKLKLHVVKFSIAGFGIIGLLGSLKLLLYSNTTWSKLLGGFILFPSIIVGLWLLWKGFLFLLYRLRGKNESFAGIREMFNLNENFADSIFATLRKFLSKSRLGILKQMVKNRVGSVVTMVADINLKHVRRLINELFYNNELFDNRRCSNYIYDYSTQNLASQKKQLEKKNWPDECKQLMIPSANLAKVAESARSTGTTLWFEPGQEKKLEEIIECGQFTTCGNLLEYLFSVENNKDLWTSLNGEIQKQLLTLKEEIKSHWESFQNDTHFLTKDLISPK